MATYRVRSAGTVGRSRSAISAPTTRPMSAATSVPHARDGRGRRDAHASGVRGHRHGALVADAEAEAEQVRPPVEAPGDLARLEGAAVGADGGDLVGRAERAEVDDDGVSRGADGGGRHEPAVVDGDGL